MYDIQTYRHTDIHTCIHADIQTYIHTCMHTRASYTYRNTGAAHGLVGQRSDHAASADLQARQDPQVNIITISYTYIHTYIHIVAIFYPFSQFCEIGIITIYTIITIIVLILM